MKSLVKIIICLVFLFAAQNAFCESSQYFIGKFEKEYLSQGGFSLGYFYNSIENKRKYTGEVLFKKPFKLRINCETENQGKISFVFNKGKLFIVTGTDDIFINFPDFASKNTIFGKIPENYSGLQKKIKDLVKKYKIKFKKDRLIWKSDDRKCELHFNEEFRFTVYVEKSKRKTVREIRFLELMKISPEKNKFNFIKKKEFELFY